MLYQMTRDVISPASQEVLVSTGEVLTAEAIMLLQDELGIDNVACVVWLEWDDGFYPTEIRHLPVITSESIRCRVVMDLACIY